MNILGDPIQAVGQKISALMGRNSLVVNMLRPWYEKALTLYHGDRGIPWTINGVPYRIDPRHRQLMGHDWDPEIAAFLSARVKPGAQCLDVGANAGIYVLQFCHWTAPDGRVVAFEPNHITRQVLQTHIRMNGLEDRVEIAPFAVSDKEGEAEFYFEGASGMSRLGQANVTLARIAASTTVTTTTLDAFCTRQHLKPDWLLIDIEGYELHALRGSRRLLARCPDLQLIVEMHPSLWPSAGTSIADWHQFFDEARLRPVALMGQTNLFETTGSIYLERQCS